MRVLVVGHERSATTWVGSVLGATADAGFVFEPDDPTAVPFAIRAMAGRGTLPVLGAEDSGSRQLTRLWDVAFGARQVRFVPGQGRIARKLLRSASQAQQYRMEAADGRIAPRLRLAGALGVPKHLGYRTDPDHYVVKSVHAPLMIDWIRARWNPTIVVCFRHPFDVVASFLAIGILRGSGKALIQQMSAAARAYGTDLYGVPVPTEDNPVPYVAWRVGLVMSALDDACRANPAFHLVEHEQMCDDPVGRFRELVGAVGLGWTADTEAFVVGSNRPGTRWQTDRVASEQKDRWRNRISPADVRAASQVLAQFPIATRYEADLSI